MVVFKYEGRLLKLSFERYESYIGRISNREKVEVIRVIQ